MMRRLTAGARFIFNYNSCPCKGKWAPFLAHGAFMDKLNEFLAEAEAQVLLIVAGLGEESRTVLLADWEIVCWSPPDHSWLPGLHHLQC